MADFHYTSPHQMTPLLPGVAGMDALRPRAAELIARAGRLPTKGGPQLRTLLHEALRPMNSYYTNKIEGQHTEPLLIARALTQDFSTRPDEARRQRLAFAHIATEQWGEAQAPTYDGGTVFSAELVRSIHRHLHDQLLPADLVQLDADDKQAELVAPGEYRRRGVKVGAHVPPAPPSVPAFMASWETGYRHQPVASRKACGRPCAAWLAARTTTTPI